LVSSDIELSDKLLGYDIPTRELEAMMQEYFRRAKQVSENEVIYFESDAKNYSIRIKYEDSEIVFISVGPGLSNEKIDDLLNQIYSALFSEQGKLVGGNVLFNYYPTDGFFRYDSDILERLFKKATCFPSGCQNCVGMQKCAGCINQDILGDAFVKLQKYLQNNG
jgi:hypothetical protein